MRTSWLAAFAALLFLACGPLDVGGTTAPDGGSPSSGPGAAPAVTIVSPPAFAELEFENEDDDHHGDDRVQIEVRVERAALAEPGQCGATAACGHLVFLIDGTACGDPNARSSSPRFEGRFGACRKPSGPHQLVVQLVDDRGNVLASSAPVVVEVRLSGRHDGGDDDHGGDDHGHGGGHG
jgi:hypothetical protein